jgi:hypothetical protein
MTHAHVATISRMQHRTPYQNVLARELIHRDDSEAVLGAKRALRQHEVADCVQNNLDIILNGLAHLNAQHLRERSLN